MSAAERMMERLKSQAKSPEEIVDVVLTGGSPWGFTLQGGSDFRSKLTVSKITPGGKADLSKSIALGDEVVAINGIDCNARAEAIELVRCSRQKLKLCLKRERNSGHFRQNGPTRKIPEPSTPNLYHTAAEMMSEFYSTYNVDRQKLAKITQNLPNKPKPMYDSTDNLSASHEDLLESYRQSENQLRVLSKGEANERLSWSSTEITNGRNSPEVDKLSFVSLPEGHWPPLHERTFTSPGRIQRVTVKSTNIATSPQKSSPSARDNESVNHAGQQTSRRVDKVERWLIDTYSPPTQRGGSLNRNAYLVDYGEASERRISSQERRDIHNSHSEQSQSLPRSKSFGGPPSYGMTVTTTALKRGESSAPAQLSRQPAWSSFSHPVRDQPVRTGASALESRHDSTSGLPLEIPPPESGPTRGAVLYVTPGESHSNVRLPKDVASPRMTISESTSSLDSVGTADALVAATRKQGPAPPPRRSVSKLLSSFRTSGRRQVAADESGLLRRGAPFSRISELASDQPKHTASRSWPTDHTLEGKKVGSETRQSWHVEPAVMASYIRRGASASGSSASSDGTQERKLSRPSSALCRSSVVIKTMRSSSSSSLDEQNAGPTVYRSEHFKPDANQTLLNDGQTQSARPQNARTGASGEPVRRRPNESDPSETRLGKTSRIEDTRILQQLMKDSVNASEARPNVRSIIRNLEGETKLSSSSVSFQEGSRTRSHSYSQEKFDNRENESRAISMSQSSSVDSLLEQHSPRRFGTMPQEKKETPSSVEKAEAGDKGVANHPVRVSAVKWSPTDSSAPSEKSERKNVTVGVVLPSLPVQSQQVVENPVEKLEMTSFVESKIVANFDKIAIEDEQPSRSSGAAEASKRSSDVITEERQPPSQEGDGELFWDADDSLPPPPPASSLDPLETPEDNLPLPSPPREMLIDFPTPRVDIVETVPGGEPSVETAHELGDELSGREKSDASILSESTMETTTSSDVSLRELSPPENKTPNSKRSSPPPPLIITSTPTKEEPGDLDPNLNSSASPLSLGSNLSTPGSRPSSILSPKLEALDKEKADLIESMNKKICDLRSQMNEIKDEIDANEELGQKVTKVVERKTNPNEFSKYQRFTGELNKIIGLLLSLTQRMHRYEMLLNDLDMSEEADRRQRDILLDKIENVTKQHEEACSIKEVNDKRGENVSRFLENCLEEDEYVDFQYYIDMKTQLALMHAEIRDKVKMGEERLNTLNMTKIDWSIVGFS